jgi:hypothetical protein
MAAGRAGLALLWLFSVPLVRAESPTSARIPLRAAVHIHSTASTGTLSLESLAQRAERQGLDVLILSDNLTLRYDYGLRPLEGILKYGVSFPSVLDYGIERFLTELREVRRRHPKLIIVPGVEVAPHYYWTGSLLAGDLTMHNAQRNVLVIGLEKSEEYARLPARGNPHSFVWDGKSLANAALFLLAVPAIRLWLPRRREKEAWRHSHQTIRRMAAAAVLVLTAGLAANAWPLTNPRFSSYDAQAGYRPYQAVIDAAIERRALAFWSMTEARDFSRHSFGPLTVTVKTDPHPDSLLLTQGYTGFGGLYQDTRLVTAPGGVWDQVAQARLNEGGPAPTMIGEVAFHGLQDAGKDLDRVYTVVLVTERTQAGVLEALRTGHAYAAARGDGDILLQLDEFSVSDRRRSAGMGDRLESEGGRPVTVRVGVSAADRDAHPVRLRVIRAGQVVGRIEGRTPLRYELTDGDAPADRWLPYRVEAIARSGELLTNPVYVKKVKRKN